MTRFEMEHLVRRSISCAKGGIEWAGIDMRILMPTLVADMEAVQDAALKEAARIVKEHGVSGGITLKARNQLASDILLQRSRSTQGETK